MRLTSSSIQPPPASVALEVLRLLVRDEDLQVIKVAFAVVAPWATKELFEVRVSTLLLSHGVVDNSKSNMDIRVNDKDKSVVKSRP